jgi:hypothetical protein
MLHESFTHCANGGVGSDVRSDGGPREKESPEPNHLARVPGREQGACTRACERANANGSK